MTSTVFMLLIAGLFVFGLLIGSFLNAVAYRVPLGISLSRSRSFCPSCKHQIAAYDNIPVLSWLILRGKCRHCRTPISDRYPFVELMTAVTFTIVGLWAWQPGAVSATGDAPLINPLAGLIVVMVAFGIALWLIDLDHLRLPNSLVYPLYPIAVIGLGITGYLTGEWPIGRALASAGVWLVVFGGIWLGTAGRGMGFGDVKLAPVLGLVLGWVGWGPSIVGLFAGFIIGGLYGITLIARSKAKRRSRVPYGPFLLLGAFTGLLLGPAIWGWYTEMMGL